MASDFVSTPVSKRLFDAVRRTLRGLLHNSPVPIRRAAIDSLESRVLFSTPIYGTPGDDSFIISVQSDNRIFIVFNGTSDVLPAPVGSGLGDGVGYRLGSQLGIAGSGPYSIDPGNTFIRYTLNGDANLDHSVNISDLAILATNWQGASKVWAQGDSNYSNTVDISDLASLATNWQQTAAPAPAANLPRARSAFFGTRRIDPADGSETDRIVK